jgi:hypothetical protein
MMPFSPTTTTTSATQNQNKNQTFIIHEHKIMPFFSKALKDPKISLQIKYYANVDERM